jgi:hypothetical protein
MANWSGWDWISYGCLGFAALGLAIGTWGKENPEIFGSLPSILLSPNWSAVPAILFALGTIIFIVRLFGAEPQTASITHAVPVASAQPMIKAPRLDWDPGGRLSLQGRYTRHGGPISVYVTYENMGGAFARRPNTVLGGTGSIEPRIKVDSISHFDEGEMADLTLGFVIDDNGKILQWGPPQQNKTKVGITFASYFGNVILVSGDGKNVDSYPFAIISTSDQQTTGANASPPIMIGPDVLLAQQQRK